MQYMTTTRIIGAPGAVAGKPLEAGVRVTIEDLRRAGYWDAEHAWVVCLEDGDIVPLTTAGGGAPGAGAAAGPPDLGDQVVALLRQCPAGAEWVRP
jgi:hypothetical protein